MNQGIQMSPEQSKAIAADYAAGLPVPEITRKHGVCSATVRNCARRAGVKMRAFGRAKGARGMTPQALERARTMATLKAAGETNDAIGARYGGISGEAVRQALVKLSAVDGAA